jgi:hypothetical protein
MRWLAAFAIAVASLAVAGAAAAVGPWPGLAATVSSADHGVRYTASRAHGGTFLLVTTPKLSVRSTITVPGELGFDAISPDRHTLYLIEHRNTSDLVQYVVRAYDLVNRALVRRAVVAKGEGETMRCYPVSRATSKSGTWVYTLYTRQSRKPFIHALNTSRRLAVCIDLRWSAPFGAMWETRLALTPDGRKLLVRSADSVVSRVDTRSFRVR